MLIRSKIFGSSLLIAGTTIGAGMLAIPIVTGVGGTLPAAGLLIGAFLFMLLSVFLLTEAAFYCKTKAANTISIIKERLGTAGSIVAWVAALLLLYSIVSAYVAGGGELIATLLAHIGVNFRSEFAALIFAVLFGALVYFHATGIDYVNRVLMIGLVGTFFLLLVIVSSQAEFDFFKKGQPIYLLGAIPAVILAFTSHIIIPSLKTYLNDDVAALRKALLIGSSIPLICYLIWQLLLTSGLTQNQLWELAASSSPTTMASLFGIPSIVGIILIFSFFALATSFIGAMLSLVDFLADGLRIPTTTQKGRVILLLTSVIPPLGFTLFYPDGFILAVKFAGVFVAVLYGILPALAVWKARYYEKLDTPFYVPGGKFSLLIMLFGSVIIIAFHIAGLNGWLPVAS